MDPSTAVFGSRGDELCVLHASYPADFSGCVYPLRVTRQLVEFQGL